MSAPVEAMKEAHNPTILRESCYTLCLLHLLLGFPLPEQGPLETRARGVLTICLSLEAVDL